MKYSVTRHFTYDSKIYNQGEIIEDGVIDKSGVEFLRTRGNIVAVREVKEKIEKKHVVVDKQAEPIIKKVEEPIVEPAAEPIVTKESDSSEDSTNNTEETDNKNTRKGKKSKKA